MADPQSEISKLRNPKLHGWFQLCSPGSRKTPATCRGGAPAIPTPSGSPKSCSSKRRSKPSCHIGNAGCANCRRSKPRPTPVRTKSTSFGRASAITPASGICKRRRDKFVAENHGGKFPDNFDDVLALAGHRPLHRRRDLQHRVQPADADSRRQCHPRADADFWHRRKSARKEDQCATLATGGGTGFSRSRITLHASRSKSRTRTRTMDEDDSACSCLNQSLMELGALVCTPRQPQCPVCPVKKLCVAFRENRAAELPNLGKRTATTARRFIAFVIERNGKFLVRQRPAGVVNAHLWEFPNVEIGPRLSEPAHEHFGVRWQSAAATPLFDRSHSIQSGVALRFPPQSKQIWLQLHRVADVAAQLFGSRPKNVNHLCTVKHSITRYRITLEAWRANFGGANSARPEK